MKGLLFCDGIIFASAVLHLLNEAFKIFGLGREPRNGARGCAHGNSGLPRKTGDIANCAVDLVRGHSLLLTGGGNGADLIGGFFHCSHNALQRLP